MRTFESLFGITINLTHWPNHEEMRHRSVGIMLKYTGTPMNEIKKVINATMKGPSTSATQKVLIYSNMLDKTVKISKKVEKYLDIDDEMFTIDVMVLHGCQTRTQKASYLDFFTSNTTTIDHDVRMLCATSGVANAGIDSRDISCAMRTEFPPSIQYICQEKGRVGRIPSASPNVFTYVICFDLN